MDLTFWQRVEILLEKNNMTRKELALNVGFDVSNICSGIKENHIPSADTAIKIASCLNTTVEYLMTGKPSFEKPLTSIDIDKYYKYFKIINYLEKIPESIRSSIQLMIKDISEKISFNENSEKVGK